MNRLTLCALLVAVGCTGQVTDPGGSIPAPGPDAPDSPIDLIDGCVDSDAPVAAPLRRLTRVELDNTLRDLLGDAAFAQAELEFGAFPGDNVGPGSIRSFAQLHSATHVEAMLSTAERAAVGLREHPEALTALDVDCVLDAAADAECVRRFVTRFGERVFRRPLTEDEILDQLAFYDAAPDADEGFFRLVTRLLNSPELLFHVESEGTVESSAFVLDDYEVANRISYMVLGTMPTDALFAAAAAGELTNAEQVEAQVRQLLDDPRARVHIERFFSHWLELDDVPGIPDEEGVLEGLPRAGLRDAMLDELDTYVETLFWDEGANYETLMTSPLAFPTDPRVAEIYGVPVWNEGSAPPATGPERGGLPLRAAMLLSESHPTAPILRGVFLRRQVLCDPLPSPDPDIVSSRLDDVGSFDPAETSSREQIEQITAAEPCATCHTQINPLTFALEEFDRLGRHRTQERVYRDGELVGEHAISTEIAPDIEDGGPEMVRSAAELVAAIGDSDKGHACFAQRVFEHTRLRMPNDGDACVMQSLYRQLREERVSLLDAYVASIAQESILTRALEETR